MTTITIKSRPHGIFKSGVRDSDPHPGVLEKHKDALVDAKDGGWRQVGRTSAMRRANTMVTLLHHPSHGYASLLSGINHEGGSSYPFSTMHMHGKDD